MFFLFAIFSILERRRVAFVPRGLVLLTLQAVFAWCVRTKSVCARRVRLPKRHTSGFCLERRTPGKSRALNDAVRLPKRLPVRPLRMVLTDTSFANPEDRLVAIRVDQESDLHAWIPAYRVSHIGLPSRGSGSHEFEPA